MTDAIYDTCALSETQKYWDYGGKNYDENKNRFYDPRTDTIRNNSDPTKGWRKDAYGTWERVTLPSTPTFNKADPENYDYDTKTDSAISKLDPSDRWRYDPMNLEWQKLDPHDPSKAQALRYGRWENVPATPPVQYPG